MKYRMFFTVLITLFISVSLSLAQSKSDKSAKKETTKKDTKSCCMTGSKDANAKDCPMHSAKDKSCCDKEHGKMTMNKTGDKTGGCAGSKAKDAKANCDPKNCQDKKTETGKGSK